MESRLCLSAARAALPMRLESKSETADQKADSPVSRRDPREPSGPVSEVARRGEDLKS